MKKKFLQENGQSVVIVTVLMIGMLAMLGLIVDGGNAYFQRRRMQNAADAAALAGGRQLALELASPTHSEYNIQVAINQYVQSNGGSTSSSTLKAFYVNQQGGSNGQIGVNGSIPPNTTGVSVTVSTPFQTFFLNVVGISAGNVAAAALVQTGQPYGVSNLFPLTVPTGTVDGPPLPGFCDFHNPAPCQIWGENQGSDSSSRQWTSFEICGGGATYLSGVLNGTQSSGTVDIGDSICTATGSITALGDNLLPWVGHDVIIPIFDCTSADPTCPDYDSQHSGSNLKYHVAAFAVFKFLGFYFNPSGNDHSNPASTYACNAITSKYICGQFERWATSADIDVTKQCTNNAPFNYGVCGFQMQQ